MAPVPQPLAGCIVETAQVLNEAQAASHLNMNERTADSYVRLLEAVFLVRRLPAWGLAP